MAGKLEIIVLGSGPSCTTPNLACLTRDDSSINAPCRCCSSISESTDDAMAAGGRKNMRGNTSAVVRKTWSDGTQSYLVQAGVGSGTGLKPALDFKIIDAHKEITIAGINFLPFEVQHGTTDVTVPMTVSAAKGNHDTSVPSSPEEFSQEATMKIKVPYMTLALLIEDKILWMTDTNVLPDRAWNILLHGVNKEGAIVAPDSSKRKLPMAFIDLADHMMIGRAHLDLRGFIETLDRLEPECTFAIGMNHTLCHGEIVALGQEAEGQRPMGYENAFIEKALYGDISKLANDGLFARIQQKRLHFRPAFDGMTVSMELEDAMANV
ncbi:hypothetical protein QFC21_002218 [Naganishia friedmannii]|uniref:Uncharacterized protein n=1 Tax=Naganishia friedmannii TaxID=89922 RepID=A0ACC2VZE7_9TREE|nr:hypothetical protein QFC21_002218 [Naganishia friedmannii]